MSSFLVNVDLNKNQIQNAALHPLGTAPSSPAVGQMYFDTTGGVVRALWWTGAAWTNDATLLNGQAGSYYLSRTNHTGTQLASTISDFDTQVRTSTLAQMAAPGADVSLNSHKITNLATPTVSTDAATKGYVDGVATGLDVKASVRAASTATVTVTYNATNGTSGRGQLTAMPNTIDGVTLAASDRVLLKDQSTGAQNGIWFITTLGTGANGVWDRATDYDADAEVTSGAFTFVTEGTVNADTGWVLTTNDPITIGGGSGTALTFAQFSSPGAYVGGAGLTLTGTTFDVGAGTGISVGANTVGIDTAVVNRKGSSLLAGSSTSYTVAHGAGTASGVLAQVILVSSGAVVWPDISYDATNITIDFAVAPSSNAYRVNWTF